MSSPYTEVQFIAFNVGPGVDSSGATAKYRGDASAEKDMKARCTIMKKAITTAYDAVTPNAAGPSPVARGAGGNVVDTQAPLKVFMAPEFYFRSKDGAYPIDVVSKILPELRKEIDKPIYADWLFVFGTAIGYLQHGDPYTEIKEVKVAAGKTVITLPYLPHGKWVGSVVDEYAEVTVTHTEWLAGTDLRVSLSRDPGRDDDDSVRFCRPPADPTAAISVKSAGPHPKSGAPTLTLDYKSQNPCPERGCGCKGHVYNPIAPRICKDCKHTHLPFDKGSTARVKIRKAQPKVTAVKEVGQDTYELTLDATYNFTEGNYAYVGSALSKEVAEILNVALVRKGSWGKQAGSGLREAVVYKEYVSAIDFLGPNYSKPEFDQPDGLGRVVEVAGARRPVMPVSGSTDIKGVLGASANVIGATKSRVDKSGKKHDYTISEINRSGLGGGSVFTIEEITFGLEVCLDHATNRLSRFYDYHCEDCYPLRSETHDSGGTCNCTKPLKRSAASGDPKVQIHLIPSWGMNIGEGKVVCVNNGLVFNVDGSRAGKANASVLRTYDGKFGCDEDLNVATATAGSCTGPTCKLAACPCAPDDKYLPAAVGVPCPRNCGRTLAEVYAQLSKSGTAVSPTGSAKQVDLSSTKLSWTDFFEVEGKILVYPVQTIPAAEKVA